MVVFVRELSVVHKQVRSCLIQFNLQHACWRLSDQICAHWRIDHSEWQDVELLNQNTGLGIELLGQLKNIKK